MNSRRSCGQIKNSAIVIGVFDGVHIGHQKIIKETIRLAKKEGLKSAVLTFDPHPNSILSKKTRAPSLISVAHRIRIICALGADYIHVAKFTPRLARMSAENFVKRFLVGRLGAKRVYIGEDFRFGKRAEGTSAVLRKMGRRYGFRVTVLRPVKKYGEVVSSSIIRHAILNGDLKKASKFLGRPVSVLGTVIRGSRRGRILGFPTANINPHHEVIPPAGVYAAVIKYKKRSFRGIVNIGFRPTFMRHGVEAEPTVEVHIFNFHKKIYGEDLEIYFARKIRPERRFRSRADLIRQIKSDIAKVKGLKSLYKLKKVC